MAPDADPEAADRYRSMLDNGVRAALGRAGDPNDEQRSHRAGLVSTSVIGINLVSKAKGDPNEIGRLIEALENLVGSWIPDRQTDLSPPN